MSVIIVLVVFIGVITGFFVIPSSYAQFVDSLSPYALYALMIFVGFDLGNNRHILKSIKNLGVSIVFLPIGVILGSLLGGALTSIILSVPISHGLAISSGLGWYSLSGVLLKELGGAEIGTIAFLTNVIRELLAFICIPMLSKWKNPLVIISPAGATSMDTTLPLIAKYAGSDTIVISLLNGMILSLLVAPLVTFFYYI